MNIDAYLKEFMMEYKDYFFDKGDSICDKCRIYNEFSLQHELGFFLRSKLSGYRVDFERNEKSFLLDRKDNLKKHEIDIVVYNETEKYAIELKYPRKANIAYNLNLFGFVKDIEFMESMKRAGFTDTYCLVVSDDPYVYNKVKDNEEGVYRYFRTNGLKDIPGIDKEITKITKKGNTITYNIGYPYKIKWEPVGENIMYYILKTEVK